MLHGLIIRISTQAGNMILATNSDLLRGEETTVIPISWESYRLKRVCSSTLAAEAMSMNAAMGELEFVYMQWYEMTNGGFDIQKWHKNANEICRSNPSAVITDCKSLFDVLEQGHGVPEDKRTAIEVLCVRSVLRTCGHIIRWVATM